LQFSYTPQGDKLPEYQNLLDKYCKSYKIVNIKSASTDSEQIDLTYYVKLHNKEKANELVKMLKKTVGIGAINIFFDDEQI
jgi:hypothetical protein